MRWIKHLTCARQDEKIVALISDCGHTACAVWWMVLEIVAGQMDPKSPKCSLTYPVSRWATELQLRPQHVKMRLEQLAVDRGVGALLRLSWSGVGGKEGNSYATVEIPNILKYRDEYSKKSGQSTDSIRTIPRSEAEQDTDTDRKQKQKQKAGDITFEEFVRLDQEKRNGRHVALPAPASQVSLPAAAAAAAPLLADVSPEDLPRITAELAAAAGRINGASNPAGYAAKIIRDTGRVRKKPAAKKQDRVEEILSRI